jgi:hypothetical protein
MLCDLTNNNGVAITNYLGVAIQAENPGTNDKTLSSTIIASLVSIFKITRATKNTSKISIAVNLITKITKEILLNRFYFTNQLGDTVTNNSNDALEFKPLKGFFSSFTITGSASLHRLINSTVSSSYQINAEVAHHIINTSSIHYIIGVTGEQIKERQLSTTILTKSDIMAELTRSKNIDTEISISFRQNAILMKRIGWWDTVIVKIKEE